MGCYHVGGRLNDWFRNIYCFSRNVETNWLRLLAIVPVGFQWDSNAAGSFKLRGIGRNDARGRRGCTSLSVGREALRGGLCEAFCGGTTSPSDTEGPAAAFGVVSMRPIPVITLLLSLATTALHAEVKLSKVFTPHMVLQRGMEVPIWGTAAPGEKVTVAFAGQSKATTADDKGAWRVQLDALKANAEPQAMTVNDKTIDDVLVGDVWIGSGQ